MTAGSAARSLGLALAGIAIAPTVAAARPPGPGGDNHMAAAVFSGIGDPICAIAGLLVLAVVAMSVWSHDHGWRVGAVVLGVLSIGLGFALAQAAAGHSAATLIGIVAGVTGLLTPALRAGLCREPAER